MVPGRDDSYNSSVGVIVDFLKEFYNRKDLL